jgi:hypothetical protein
MDPLLFSVGGLVFAVAIFRRRLLIEKFSFRIILVSSSILFIIGLVVHFVAPERYSGIGAFLSPLLSLALYRLGYAIFKGRLLREPRDTWLDWSEGMGADRIFNIVYFSLAALVWMFTAAYL